MKRLFLAFFFLPLLAEAQFIEDGLRLGEVNSVISARAAGLGVSYIGINDDGASLRINPAGLSLLPTDELSFGFAFRNLQTETQYNGQSFDQTPTNSFYLSNIILAIPIDEDNTMAIGYFNEAQNDMRIEYNTFNENPNSSIFSQKQQLGFDLYLAPDRFNPLVTDSVRQDNFTIIEGGKHSIYFGGAFKVHENISFGFNIAPKWGSITTDRIYSEFDATNKYNQPSQDFSTVDFNSFEMTEFLRQDYTGVTGAIGFQVNYSDFLRFGGNVEMPSYYLVEESYGASYAAFFDQDAPVDLSEEFENEYSVITPPVFSGGVSLHFLGTTVTAGISYADYSQMEFDADDYSLVDLNRDILRQLKGKTTYGVGAEYQFPALPLTARVSYEHFVSPFYEDGPEASGSTYAIGGSLLVGEQTSVDGVFRYRDYNFVSVFPGGNNFITNVEQPLTIAIGLTYRY